MSEVGMTIINQMGGQRRLGMFLGVKQFVVNPKGVSFKFPNKQRSKPNCVKVALDADDTYSVTFSRVGRINFKVISELSGVYFDQLIPLFERTTGLLVSF